MSSAPSIGVAKCNNLISALKYVFSTGPTDLVEDEICALVYQYYLFVRGSILRPYCTNSILIAPLHLSIKSFSETWYKQIDRKVEQALGPAAGMTAPTKQTGGSLHDALVSELEVILKRKKQTELNSIVDILDAFASQRVHDWHNTYLQPSYGVTYPNERTRGERVGFCAHLIQVFFTSWSNYYRNSNEKKLCLDLSDYREMVLVKSKDKTIFELIYNYVANQSHQQRNADQQRRGHIKGVHVPNFALAAQQNAKHLIISVKIESFLATQKDQIIGSGSKSESSGDHVNVGPIKRCKAGDDCCEIERDIPAGSKYILARCTSQCAMSFHPHCYRSLNYPEADPPDGDEPFKCMNTKKSCDGHIVRVVLKNSHEILTSYAGSEIAEECDLAEDEESEEDEEEEEEDESLQLPRKKNALGIRANTLHRAEQYELGEDGLLQYKDRQLYNQRKAIQEEKKKRDQERAEAKKKREEELAKEREEKERLKEINPPPNKEVQPIKKLSSKIEVVFAPQRQPGESSPPMAPTKSNLSIGSSSDAMKKNPFNVLNLNAEEKSQSRRPPPSAWHDHHQPPVDELPDGVQGSLIPITVKKNKKKNGGGGGFEMDEDEQMRLAMQLSLAEANSKKTAAAEAAKPKPKPVAQPPPSVAQSLFGSKKLPNGDEFPGLPGARPSILSATPQSEQDARRVAAAAVATYGSSSSNHLAATPQLEAEARRIAAAAVAAAFSTTNGGSVSELVHSNRQEGEEAGEVGHHEEPGSENHSQAPSSAAVSVDSSRSGSPSLSSQRSAAAPGGVNQMMPSPLSVASATTITPPPISISASLPNFSQRAVAIPMAGMKAAAPMAAKPLPSAIATPMQQITTPTSYNPAITSTSSSAVSATSTSSSTSMFPPPVGASLKSMAASFLNDSPNPAVLKPSPIMPAHIARQITPTIPTTITPPPVMTSALQPPPSPMTLLATQIGAQAIAPTIQTSTSGSSTPLSGVVSPTASTPISSAPTPTATKVDVVDSVVISDTPTSILQLRDLPTCITIQHLGSLFCKFGRVQVRLVFTVSHGLTGIITYQTLDSANRAMGEMNGAMFEVISERVDGEEYDQWVIQPIYARQPIQLVPPPLTTIKRIN